MMMMMDTMLVMMKIMDDPHFESLFYAEHRTSNSFNLSHRTLGKLSPTCCVKYSLSSAT